MSDAPREMWLTDAAHTIDRMDARIAELEVALAKMTTAIKTLQANCERNNSSDFETQVWNEGYAAALVDLVDAMAAIKDAEK